MIWLEKLKTTAFILAAIGFLFTASLSSCGNKKTEGEATEQAEHPEGAGEHPEGTGEHPEGEEHPTDSIGGEHPDN
ncbi:MAG: hypothetical protein H0X62_17710 [Bacteroidetes bacterium]|nr:hypothetical protein [Bacteroidota bacterium]